MICPKCGTPNGPESNSCIKCGHTLADGSTTATWGPVFGGGKPIRDEYS